MNENSREKIQFADFAFEKNGNILFRRGGSEIIALEPSAARVLRFFLENSGRLISKEELLKTVWAEVFTTEDVLKRAVSQIRRALGDDAKNSRFIETHHRRGYRFVTGEKNDAAVYEENIHAQTDKNNSPADPHFDCFVGRAREIDFLRAEFRRVLQGAGQPVLIAGEPGVGKTQTAAKFVEWACGEAKNALPLRVRFFDYEASFLPAYDVFLDLLSEACAAIFGAVEKAELRKLVENKLKIILPDELFNLNASPGQTSTDASRAIVPLAESFVRLSRIRPLVLIFDDIQWADETSRKIIGYLMRIASDAPLMIIGLTRRGDAQDLSSSLREWLGKQAAYRSFTTLELAPLSKENCRALTSEVFRGQLDVNEIPARDLAKLHTATGGNPYFLVETLRLLLNENVIEKTDSGWHWRGLENVPLPETIRMAARAKLLKLPDAAREIVECAAVLGDSFQIETLGRMLENDFENFDNALDEAIAAQVLSEENVSGADDCQFYHTTLRRAVYIDLSPRRRKRLHMRAMRAIETSHHEGIEKFTAALAAHAENAGDYRASLKLNLQACRAAAVRFDWFEAAELLTRAERAAEQISNLEDREKLEFLFLRGEVYMSIGRRAEAERLLAESAALAEKPSAEAASNMTANIFLNLGRTRILLGKYREAIPVLEKSLSLANDDSFIASAVRIQLASAKYALCEYEESSEILSEIIAEEDSQSYNRAVALGKLGWLRSLQSRYAEGKNLLEQALRFHQTAGDLRERAVLAMCLNSCEYGLGNYEAAIEYARQARREAQIVGEPYNESVAQMRVGKARIAQGLYAEAEKLLSDAWATQKDLDAPHAQAETIWMRGRLDLEQGDFPKAAKNLQTALEMIRSVGDRDDEFRIMIDRARLQTALGDYDDALQLAKMAEEIAAEIGILEGAGEALTVQSGVLLRSENIIEAVRAAREAVQILEKFDSGERWRADYALAAALLAAQSSETKEAEFSLARAVATLDKMRGQFSDAEKLFYVRLTNSLNASARLLRDFLDAQNRSSEAKEISLAWLLD